MFIFKNTGNTKQGFIYLHEWTILVNLNNIYIAFINLR